MRKEKASGFRLPATGFAVEVTSRLRRGAPALAVLRKAAREFLGALHLEDRGLSILLVGDAAMRTLNRKWRSKDQPTDVLSFPASEAGSRKPKAGSLLGDVVLSLDTATRQAREGGWPLAAELRRLLAHGMLHCLGHDHEAPGDARKMALAERRLLGKDGLVGDARR